MSSGDRPKGRGIYSETVTTEDTENLKVGSSNVPNISIIIFVVGINDWTFSEQRHSSEQEVKGPQSSR